MPQLGDNNIKYKKLFINKLLYASYAVENDIRRINLKLGY